MSELQNGRNEVIDIMKGVGICLIVLGHLEPGTYLMRFVYSFHLFLFFVCSGFVGRRYKNRSIRQILVNNVKRLIIPFCFWESLSLLLDIFLGNIDLMSAGKDLLFLDANVGWNAALWFLVCLFWTDTICALLIRLNFAIQVAATLLSAVIWYLLSAYSIVLPFGLYTIFPAICFWMIGYWVNRYNVVKSISNMNVSRQIVLAGIFLIVNIFCGTLFNGVISIYHMAYSNIILTIIAGICGVGFMLSGSILIKQYGDKITRILIKYGNNTLTILCTHYFILRVVRVISLVTIKIDLWRSVSTVKSILIAGFVLALYYPALILVEKLKIRYSCLRYLL